MVEDSEDRPPRSTSQGAGHLNVEQPPSARGHRCELAFTGVIICACWSLEVFGTTGLGADQLAMLPPFLVIDFTFLVRVVTR